jgi:hypothetical protein
VHAIVHTLMYVHADICAMAGMYVYVYVCVCVCVCVSQLFLSRVRGGISNICSLEKLYPYGQL